MQEKKSVGFAIPTLWVKKEGEQLFLTPFPILIGSAYQRIGVLCGRLAFLSSIH